MNGSAVEIIVLIVGVLLGFAAGYFWKSRSLKPPPQEVKK